MRVRRVLIALCFAPIVAVLLASGCCGESEPFDTVGSSGLTRMPKYVLYTEGYIRIRTGFVAKLGKVSRIERSADRPESVTVVYADAESGHEYRLTMDGSRGGQVDLESIIGTEWVLVVPSSSVSTVVGDHVVAAVPVGTVPLILRTEKEAVGRSGDEEKERKAVIDVKRRIIE